MKPIPDIALIAAEHGILNVASDTATKAKALEAQGWRVWLTTLLPFWFSDDFSDEHIEFWEHWWEWCQKLKRGEKLTGDEGVGLLALARGLGKSASIEAACMMRGALLNGGYALMISETDDQAQEHIGNCKILIEHPDSKLTAYYPMMAIADAADITKGMPTAERKEMFICRNGFILRAKGLTAKMRGLRIGIRRPDALFLDDIDDINDSLAVSLSKERQITASIFPVLVKDGSGTIVVAQNLISENSFVNRVFTGRADALANRAFTIAQKAFVQLDLDVISDARGNIRNIILDTSVPSWHGLNVDAAQRFLDNSGLNAFLAEYQNEFDRYKAGRVIANYNEEASVITWSQFEKVYGTRRIPEHWRCRVGVDVGYSEGQYPHWSAWMFLTAAAEKSAMPGLMFLYRMKSYKGKDIDEQAEDVKRSLWPNENIERWGISHEKTGEMMTLQKKHNLPFRKFTKFGKEDGLSQWRHLQQVDIHRPNPFKDDEELDGGVYRIGRPQLYYIVDDDQLAFGYDDTGLKLFREQVASWEYVTVKLTETGLTEQKPSKVNDDAMDSFRYILAENFGPSVQPMSQEEKIIAKLPDLVMHRLETATNGMDRLAAVQAYEFERSLVEDEMGVTDQAWDDWE